MKCELCHKADAQTAITRGEGETEEELYVCNACAKAERQRRQKKSLRTRKMSGLPPGVSMSITQISGGDGEEEIEPPPFLGAIVNAFHDMVSDLEKAKKAAESESKGKKAAKPAELPLSRFDAAYRVRGRLHLEGLHLIGELEPVKRAVRALGGELVGIDADGVRDVGHVYALRYTGPRDMAVRVAEDIVESERSARVRLFEELPRVYGDALRRSLAIMKNCRLLSPGELFDLLSPMRIAAREGLLDGMTSAEVEGLMRETDLSGAEDRMDQSERDHADAERADDINRRFEDVVLNERAEDKQL